MKLRILSSIVAVTALFGVAAPALAQNPSHVRRLRATNACQFCDLSYVNFRGANLGYASLQSARLWDADFRGADLRGANFRGADLRGANFRGADLEGADFQGADIRGANFRGALNTRSTRR